MHDVELAEDGGGVVGQDHFLEMVDDELVAAVRAERGLDGAGDGAARVDVAQDGAILGVVARPSSVPVDAGARVAIPTFGSRA